MSQTLIVIASFAPSLINFRGELLRSVREVGWRVVACAPSLDDAVRSALADLDVEPVEVPLDRSGLNPARDLRTITALATLMRRVRPDCVFSYTVKPVIYGSLAARLTRVPRVVAMLTGLGTMFTTTGAASRAMRPAIDGLFRSALAGCDAVVFQNSDDRGEFVERGLVRPERTRLVAGSGVNLAHFARRPLPVGPVRFLMIARLLVDKGVREYAAAAQSLRKRGLEAECHLVGPLERHPRAVAEDDVRRWQDEGVVVWHGPAQDVRPHLEACTVYVLPSYREGTPRSVLEALAVGRPVITTDAPGCRETVADGVNGFLVAPRDAEALAGAMASCVEGRDQLEAMAAESARLARERYDVNVVNRDVLEILGVNGPGS